MLRGMILERVDPIHHTDRKICNHRLGLAKWASESVSFASRSARSLPLAGYGELCHSEKEKKGGQRVRQGAKGSCVNNPPLYLGRIITGRKRKELFRKGRG